MVNLVRLKFECIVKCNPEFADELGSDIAQDLFNDFENGVDYLEWSYHGFHVVG